MGPDAKRHARTALTWALMLALNAALFAPRLIFPNPTAGGTLEEHPVLRPTRPGIAYELGLLFCLLALTAGSRLARPARRAGVAIYAGFLVFSIYHEAYHRFVCVPPAVVDDWRLLLNLAHFIRIASAEWIFLFAMWVVAYVLTVVLAAFTFRRVQEGAEGLSRRLRLGCTVGFAVIGAGALIGLRQPPANAIVQPVSDVVIANVKASQEALAHWRAIFGAPPDTRYDAFQSVPLQRRPNVYLLMIEAYGEVLATCPSRTAYRDLVDRMSARFTKSGFHMRSGYSTAPIYGARSWLTMASVQTGIHIDAQPAYRVLEKSVSRIPTLTKFFKAHGYHTMMLQPLDEPRVGVASEDIYQRDRIVVRADIPFKGPKSGLSGIPDQFSLGYFNERVLASAPEPRFVFYMAVSTHYPWWVPAPFVRDYKQLDTPRPEDAAPWAPLAGRDAVTDKPFSDYLATVEYEWRVLADFIDARRDEDALIIVVGDHQPTRLDCPGVPVTFNTPIHVLSKDRRLVEPFADVGLEPGLFAEPGRHAPLKHEGLFSLLVSKLAAIDRPSGAAVPAYFPAGIPLTGLRR